MNIIDKIIYSRLCIEDLESIGVILRRDPQLLVAYACERSDDEYSYKCGQHYKIICINGKAKITLQYLVPWMSFDLWEFEFGVIRIHTLYLFPCWGT
jgi:hypothetical protein